MIFTGSIFPFTVNRTVMFLGADIGVGFYDKYFFGKISEIRAWQFAYSDEEILYKYNKRCNPNPSITLDELLVIYFDFAVHYDGTEDYVSYKIVYDLRRKGIDDILFSFLLIHDDPNVNEVIHTDGPPVGLGGSFIAAEFPVSLSKKVSLKYPLIAPADCNFCLCVRWIDDDGVVQRRKLWTVGEDIGPDPAFYQGETLPKDFDFEIWNIDGNHTVDLTSDFTIATSILKKATDSLDVTVESLGTLVLDDSIYAAFPFSFSQDFLVTYDYGENTWTSALNFLMDENGHAIVDESGLPILIDV